jgi:ribose/xylose/arabinose/galactoside ABC-type transport system permease subunit
VVCSVVALLAAAAAGGSTTSRKSMSALLNRSAVICVLALGQLLVVVTRGIDLSVGSNAR